MLKQKIPCIFVVNEEKMISKTLALLLQKSGYFARFFLNSSEALLASLSEPPDLLISDVMMPHLSGIDLAIRMKEQCPTCTILLFSGRAGSADLLEVAREQDHDFHILSKPIYPSDLLRRLRAQDAAFSPTIAPPAPVMDQPVPPRHASE